MNYMMTELGIWEIAVLAFLREEPMHPYQMQSLLRLRHKDEILALKRGSLYHAIGRLVRDELITAKSTSRNGRPPNAPPTPSPRRVARSSLASFATSLPCPAANLLSSWPR